MVKKKRHLVIVESPAKAKTINKILGKEYLVKASYGHVRDLPKSKLGVDPESGFEVTYVPLDRKKKVIGELRAAAAKCDKVYLCPDPDREGEAIAHHLSCLLGVDPSMLFRVTFNEITPRAVKEAFKHPRGIDHDLVASQQARRVLDRIVGYQLSPLLWKKILMGISAGRVQSVAVRMIVEREQDIMAFKPQEYWTIETDMKHDGNEFSGSLRSLDDKRLASSASDLNKKGVMVIGSKTVSDIVKALDVPSYRVTRHDVREVVDRAGPPFTTSMLQQAAANALGFGAKRTMRVAQQLYEGVSGDHGLITYMRTDSFRVSQDASGEARALVKSSFGEEYCPGKPNFFRSRKGSQEGHECIRPSDVSLTPDAARAGLSSEQGKLYGLIWRRFVASQMSPAKYESTTCDMEAGTAMGRACIRATGRRMTFDGWRRVLPGKKEDAREIPDMNVDDEVTLARACPEKHVTQPSARYNDATLVKAMEAAGVGRPSTYASILSVIQDRNYATKKGTGGREPLRPTPLGMVITKAMVGRFAFMDIDFTSKMEERLDEVEEGKVAYEDLLSEFYEAFTSELRAASDMPSMKDGEKTEHKCPSCGSEMLKRLSKFGYFLKCTSKKCGTTMNVGEDGTPMKKLPPVKSGLSCDDCGADMVHAKGRFGPYLCCEKYIEDKSCTFTMSLTKAGLPRRKLAPLSTGIACDKCKGGKKGNGEMVVRIRARGKNPKPKPFMGCSLFPKCRNAMDLPDDDEALLDIGKRAVARWKELREHDKADLDKFIRSE